MLGHTKHLDLFLLFSVVYVAIKAGHHLQVGLIRIEARLVLRVDQRSQRKGRTQSVLHETVSSRLEAESAISKLS